MKSLSSALTIGMGLVGTVLAMLFVFFGVVGARAGVVVAQALGSKRRGAADAAARAAWGASSWIGGVFMLLAAALAAPLLRLMNAPPEVLPLAVPLLQPMAPVVLLDAWNSTAASVLRSQLALAVPLMGGVASQGRWAGWGLAGYAVALQAARGLGLGSFLQVWRTRLGVRPRVPTGVGGRCGRRVLAWPVELVALVAPGLAAGSTPDAPAPAAFPELSWVRNQTNLA